MQKTKLHSRNECFRFNRTKDNSPTILCALTYSSNADFGMPAKHSSSLINIQCVDVGNNLVVMDTVTLRRLFCPIGSFSHISSISFLPFLILSLHRQTGFLEDIGVFVRWIFTVMPVNLDSN